MSRTSAVVIAAVAVFGLTAFTGLAQRDAPPDLGPAIVVDSTGPAGSSAADAEPADSAEASLRRAEGSAELSTAEDDDDAGPDGPSRDGTRERAGWVTDERDSRVAPASAPRSAGEDMSTLATMQHNSVDDGDVTGEDSGGLD